MNNTLLKSTRRHFLKLTALAGSVPAGASKTKSGRALTPIAPPVGPVASMSDSKRQLDRTVLRQGIIAACEWMGNVAQMKTDALTVEHNSFKLPHRHWRGALRGEYRASTRQWDFYGPVWHTGQAIKSLVWASQALNRPELLNAARLGAEFIGTERVTDRADPHYGLIFAFENIGNASITSGVFEAVDGLWVLADATGDNRYAEWANAAAAWEARNSYLGDGLFRDRFDVTTLRPVPAAPGAKPGRPLNDDAVYLKAFNRTGITEFRTLFYEVADCLLRDEEPAGNWINYGPCNSATGMIHPRQAYWWGRAMIDAYRDSHDARYLACAQRAGEWYQNAMRLDGGLFRGTRRDFKTDSFSHATSGVACAVLLWEELWKETHEECWLESIRTGLDFCQTMQIRSARDPNLQGVVIEGVEAPDGTDASPYNIRDLSTIFFVQAAARLIMEKIPA